MTTESRMAQSVARDSTDLAENSSARSLRRTTVMRSRRLPQVLRNVVALTLASTGAYACAGDLGSDMEPACTGQTSAASIAGWRPAQPVDFMVMRNESFAAGQPEPFTRTETERVGEPCKTASDRTLCERQLEEMRLANAQTIGASYLAFTRGDQVFALKTPAEMEEFLRPIDTKEEAFFVLSSKKGFGAQCGTSDDLRWKETDDGFDVLVYDYANNCRPGGGQIDRVVMHVSRNGDVSELEREHDRDTGNCSEGRRPCGLRSNGRAKKARSSLGAYFAKASHLEAASVVAFAQLEEELAALGAPPRILRALAKARADEVRHARMTSRLAKRFGATPPAVRVKRGRNRGALAIAIENAREGCVRETLGAVIALHRAERAKDVEVARAMRAIAADELRHARLSWELMEWLDGKLTARGRAAVRRAFAREIAALGTELVAPPRDVAEIAGAPDARTLRALFDRVAADVWKPALAA